MLRRRLPTLFLLALLSACGGDGSGSDEGRPVGTSARSAGAYRPALDCEERGYPCRWAEVDPEVVRASRELGDEGMDRLIEEGPDDALGWIEKQDDVAAAGRVDDDLWFRLDGGRRIWLLSDRPADVYREGSGDSGPGPAAFGPGPATEEARSQGLLGASVGPPPFDLVPRVANAALEALTANPAYHVAGRDRTGDDAIDQRDVRRALILTPFHFDHSESLQKGDELARILDRDAGFEVTWLRDSSADLAAFGDWDEYDVIHLITHGNGYAWITGQEVDWGRWEEGGMDARPEMRRAGLDVTYLRVSEPGTDERERRWYYGVPSDFLRAAYPGGLDGSVVLVSGCRTAGAPGESPPPGLRALLGERTMVGGWSGRLNLAYGGPAAVAFTRWLARGYSGAETLRRLSEEGLDRSVDDPDDPKVYASLRLYGPDGQYGKDLRIREIVTLLHPAPPRALGSSRLALRDESPFHGLVQGIPGDGRPDDIGVNLEVEGIPAPEAASTHVWLELDGRRLGDPVPVTAGVEENDRWTLSLGNVPTGVDLAPDRTYELAAVVGTAEGSESRYAVELAERSCTPEVMAAAVADDVVPGAVTRPSGDAAPRHLPSPSRLEIRGLLNDGGDACTHHLSSVGMLGSILTSDRDPDDARDEMLGRLGDLTEDAREAAGGEFPSSPPSDPSTRGELGRILGAMPSITGDQDGDVVIEIYSPHLMSWRLGMTTPIVTEHEGIAGWAANASASVTIQLPGTAAADLKEGESYRAAAYAPQGDADRKSLDVIPTAGPLYSRWSGERVPRPRLTRSEGGRGTIPEQIAECEQGKAEYRAAIASMGDMTELQPFFDRQIELIDCRYRGTAFSGTVESAYGRLSGTLTVDEIAGGEVRGRFRLGGDGTLVSERHRLVRNENGKVLRSDAEATERQGTVSIEGTFAALAVGSGELRLLGNQTVALASASGIDRDDRRAELPSPARGDEGPGPDQARDGPILGPGGDRSEGGGTDGGRRPDGPDADRPEADRPVDGRSDYERPDEGVLREATRTAERLRPRALRSGELRLEGSSPVVLPAGEISLQLHCDGGEPEELVFLLGREGNRGMVTAERTGAPAAGEGGGRVPVDIETTLTGEGTPSMYEGEGVLVIDRHEPASPRLSGRMEGSGLESLLSSEEASLILRFDVGHACSGGPS